MRITNIEEIIKEILSGKINKVILNDESEYNPDTCHTGGNYAYYTIYERVANTETWEMSFGTSAEFDYCPVCGNFQDHRDPDGDGYICGDFEIITTDELNEVIRETDEMVECYYSKSGQSNELLLL